ncbi:MAG: hypothetical protein KG003_01895 [Bacteroidetes bacterium]|nr:hypothetical protein [Bacteroidota bacterium]
MKKLFLIHLLLFAFVHFVSAQATVVASREFDADDFLKGSLNMNEAGIMMYGWEEKGTFACKALDKNLDNYASWTISTEKRATLADITYSQKTGQAIALIQTGKSTYLFVAMDVKTKKKKTTELLVPKGTGLREILYAVGDQIWFVGYNKKSFFLYTCDIASPKLVPLDPGISGEKFNILNLDIMDNDEVAVVYSFGPKKLRELDVLVLDAEGKTLVPRLMESASIEERNLAINASVTRLGKGDYALTGNYNKKGKSDANGVYFARYSDGKIGYLSNFDYSDFDHFYDHLSAKEREKREAKIEKKKSKGKDVTLTALSIMHKTISTKTGLVFIAEYYYPTYYTVTTTSYSGGKATTTTRTEFDGYQYTHALIVGIDKNGKKVYDLNFPIRPQYKPFVPVRFLRTYSDSDIVHMVYTSGRRIYSARVEDNKLENKYFDMLNKLGQNEKDKGSASSSIYWYDNYFFILEIEKTKEKGLGGKRTTKRFAFKVEVQE